jgi:hypothetical protein
MKMPKFLAKKSITNMDHPPYSPDLAPCIFFGSFQIKKNALKRQRLAGIPDIQSN